MSLNRYAKKRDANERGIIEFLEGHGYEVEPLGDAPFDLLVTWRLYMPTARQRDIWLLEVKGKRGKLTQRQVDFRKRFPVSVVRNGVEALAAVSGR